MMAVGERSGDHGREIFTEIARFTTNDVGAIPRLVHRAFEPPACCGARWSVARVLVLMYMPSLSRVAGKHPI